MISFYNLQADNEQSQPCPRWGHAMVCIQNEIFLFGGYENSKYYNDLWKFNLDKLGFEKMSQHGDIPPPCSNFTLNYDPSSNSLLLFGGGTLNKQKLNSVYKLNCSSFTWEKIFFPENASLPWQRSYHCAEIIANYLVIYSGEFFHDLDDTWILNLNTNEWKQIKLKAGAMKPKARKFASSFVHNNKLYVVGGCSGKYECVDQSICMDFSQFLDCGDEKLLQWKQVQFKGKELMMRWGHISIVKGNKAYVFGGRYNNKDLQNLVEIDLNNSTCKQMNFKGDSPKGRRRPGMCLRNNSLFCFSGFDGSYIKDFIYFNLPFTVENSKINENTQGAQCLHKYLAPNNVEEQSINFSDEVFYVTEDQFEQIESYLQTYKTNDNVYFVDTKYMISANKLTKIPYFAHLLKGLYSDEEFSFYSPSSTSKQERQILLKMFLSYCQFGKVVVSRCQFGQSKLYFKYLLQVAEYYCCNQLQEVCKRQLLKFFTDQIVSPKPNMESMLQISQTLCLVNMQYENYVAYFIVKKLADKHRLEIKTLIDMQRIIKQSAYDNKQWILMMVHKYSFELTHLIAQKKEVGLENINNENIPHKEEILYEKTRKGSMHNRHINV